MRGKTCHYCERPAKLDLVIAHSNLEIAIGYPAAVRQPVCVSCASKRAVDDPGSPWYTERVNYAR